MVFAHGQARITWRFMQVAVSCASRNFLRANCRRRSRRSAPSLRITRWQGITMVKRLRAFAPPTARILLWGEPDGERQYLHTNGSRRKGIAASARQTERCKGVPCEMRRGRSKAILFPSKYSLKAAPRIFLLRRSAGRFPAVSGKLDGKKQIFRRFYFNHSPPASAGNQYICHNYSSYLPKKHDTEVRNGVLAVYVLKAELPAGGIYVDTAGFHGGDGPVGKTGQGSFG